MMKVDLIALTHYHGDHIFGLPGLLQTMNCMGRTEPLCVTGPAGLDEFLSPILHLTGETVYPIRTFEMGADGFRLRNLSKQWPREARLSAFRTEHRVSSCGYVFTLDRYGRFMPEKAKALSIPLAQWNTLREGNAVTVNGTVIEPEQVLGPARKGIKFAFTGDTAQSESIEIAASGADLMICEATYAEDSRAELAKERGHMNFAQAAATAERAKVRQLCLAHFSQAIEDPELYLENATGMFENTVCGRDGMRFVLEFDTE